MSTPPGRPFGIPVTTPPGRLESWKAVAAYLRRSVSTVQRWEQDEGLPVHRLLHSKAGSVYALTSELDEWYSRRDPLLDARADAAEHAAARSPHTSSAADAPSPRARRWSQVLVFVAMPAVAIATASAAIVAWQFHLARTRPVMRADFHVAPADELNAGGSGLTALTPGGSRTALAWTPDGQGLVFVGRQGGRQRLYVRDLARAEAYPLPDTDEAQEPVVDPDGRSVVFWAHGEIRRAPLTGGAVQNLVAAVHRPPAGIAVGRTGRIVFSASAPAEGPFSEAIWASRGGGPVRLTSHESGERQHLLPQLIADERVLLFTVRRDDTWGTEQVVAQVLATGTRAVLLEDAADARYVPGGYLVFLRRGLLMAAPFDERGLRVTGEPRTVVDGVAQALVEDAQADAIGAGQFAVSPTGALAYVSGVASRDAGPRPPVTHISVVFNIAKELRATR